MASRRFFQGAEKHPKPYRSTARVVHEPAERDELFTTEQVRIYLNRGSLDAVYRLVRDCGLPRVWQGNAWRFSKQQIDRWQAAQMEPQAFGVVRGGRG